MLPAHLLPQYWAVQLKQEDQELEARPCFVARPHLPTSKQSYQRTSSRNYSGVDLFPFAFYGLSEFQV